MAFELRSEESLRKGVLRLARKQLENALEELASARPRNDSVHDARKALKRVRALSRLIRPAVGDKSYRELNLLVRDAGRPLTDVRDARVFIDTLDKLVEHFHQQLSGHAFAELRRALQENLRAVRKRVFAKEKALVTVRQAVRKASAGIAELSAVPMKWSSVRAGVEDVFRRAADAFAAAVHDPAVETLHEWRKQAKYLRHQLEVLRQTWPEHMEELTRELAQMGDLLGDDHDLAVLRQLLSDDPTLCGVAADAETLVALIDRRRADLGREAKLIGERFFQEKPGDFILKLDGYWKVWRSERRQQQVEALAAPAAR